MSQSNTTRKNLGHATAYGYAKAGGYTGTEEEFAALMADYAEVAEEAEESAENSEAWAVGKRNGVDVGPTDDTYQNNAKYYKSQAAASEANALIYKDTAYGYKDDAKGYKDDAEDAATAAAASAEAAASVFAVVGNVAFSVLPNGQVRETWTEEES